jgi:hypothetical protein
VGTALANWWSFKLAFGSDESMQAYGCQLLRGGGLERSREPWTGRRQCASCECNAFRAHQTTYESSTIGQGSKRELNGYVCQARGEVGSLYTCPTRLDCCFWPRRPLQRRYRSSGPSIARVGNRKRSLPKSNIRSEKDPTVPRSPGCVLQTCCAPLVRCSTRSK